MARILVIEDNAASLQLMVYLLRAFGHETLEAVDGVEGLARVERENPDLIVCDVHIPRVDGYEVCRRLKADPVLREIPIIAVTALAMVGDRAAIMAAGFDGYISKPIDPETFVAEVERYLPNGEAADAPRTPMEAAVGLAVPQPEAVPGPRSVRAGNGQGAVALVLDDRVANRQLAHSILEPCGYRVLHAGTVAEALALLEREHPDVILADVHLPDGTGLELIQVVRADARWRDIPFVFITSTAWPDDDLRRGMALGARSYLIRPIEPRVLLDEVEACLREREKA